VQILPVEVLLCQRAREELRVTDLAVFVEIKLVHQLVKLPVLKPFLEQERKGFLQLLLIDATAVVHINRLESMLVLLELVLVDQRD
jgi:hypothetical protein